MRRRPLIVGALVAFVFLTGFWELAEDFAYSPAIRRFDAAVAAAIQSLRTPALTAIMRAVTVCGGTAVVSIVMFALLVALLLRHRRFDAVFVAAGVGGGMLLSTLAKDHFGRDRPPAANALIPLPESMSFPSGHSMASLCLGTVLAYLAVRSEMRRSAKVAAVIGCVAYALAVGVSRVYLGVHWPSDVLASWLLGGAWLSIVIGVAESLRTE